MFTNKTANLDLPQWVGTDKANWDIDLNYAFKQISDYVNTLNEKFSGLDSTDGQFDASIKEINKNIETINTAIDSINEVDGIQSADIKDLKEKVTKLQTDVSELTTSSTDLIQRVQSIENELPSINQSITTLTQNYNTLNSKVENSVMYVTTKVAVIGDNKLTDDKPKHGFILLADYRRVRTSTESVIKTYDVPAVLTIGTEFTPADKVIGTIIVQKIDSGATDITLTIHAQMDVGEGGAYSNFRIKLEGEELPADANLVFTVLRF